MRQAKKFFFSFLLVFFVFFFCEGLARLFFMIKPSLENLRLIARGEVPPLPSIQKSIAQAYLLYIPAPNYKTQNGLEHNSQGYRGKAVSMRRTPGVLRVLCLGGSTVYGWGVENAEQAYPPQLEKLLNEKLPSGVQGVEVMNGGLPFAITAEMLTHYHFKYHYYKPDLVIIEAGGNDGMALDSEFYHPDYSHWRQPLQLAPAPARLVRMLMRSRLISLAVIPLFYGPHPQENTFQRDGTPPTAQWYEPPKDLVNPPFNIPEDEMAMKHDLDSLIAEIKRDGAEVLLVPFRLNPRNDFIDSLREAISLNERIMKKMALSLNLPMAPFPGETISPVNWTDDCHLNEAGEIEKARHIAPYVKRLLFT